MGKEAIIRTLGLTGHEDLGISRNGKYLDKVFDGERSKIIEIDSKEVNDANHPATARFKNLETEVRIWLLENCLMDLFNLAKAKLAGGGHGCSYSFQELHPELYSRIEKILNQN
ncbi:hypothetical protein KAR91_12185 [Candidatus Pacearchaeota archaeon]|nr:hypothetical protein [Candidatus Pacearchaeota archaeon]